MRREARALWISSWSRRHHGPQCPCTFWLHSRVVSIGVRRVRRPVARFIVQARAHHLGMAGRAPTCPRSGLRTCFASHAMEHRSATPSRVQPGCPRARRVGAASPSRVTHLMPPFFIFDQRACFGSPLGLRAVRWWMLLPSLDGRGSTASRALEQRRATLPRVHHACPRATTGAGAAQPSRVTLSLFILCWCYCCGSLVGQCGAALCFAIAAPRHSHGSIRTTSSFCAWCSG